MAEAASATTPDACYAQLAARLTQEPDVSWGTGRKGFGSTALQYRGKMFALLSVRGEFVVKLDATRVAALVAQDQGSPYTMGGVPCANGWWWLATAAPIGMLWRAKPWPTPAHWRGVEPFIRCAIAQCDIAVLQETRPCPHRLI